MPDPDLEARIDAIERAVTGEGTDVEGIREAAALSEDVESLAERVSALEAQLAELEAAVQAVRGYAGNVRAVNRDVERRANAALATAERLERAIDGPERDQAGREDPAGPSANAVAPDSARRVSTSDSERQERGGDPERREREGDPGRAGRVSDAIANPDAESNSGSDAESNSRSTGSTSRTSGDDANERGDRLEEPRRVARGNRGRENRLPRGVAREKKEQRAGTADGSTREGPISRRSERRGKTFDVRGEDRGRGEREDVEPGRTEQFIERVRDAL